MRQAIRHQHGIIPFGRKLATVYFKEGVSGLRSRLSEFKAYRRRVLITGEGGIDYDQWLKKESAQESRSLALKILESFDSLPRFSIIFPTYNPDPVFLKAAIDSVIDQVYPHWELCIADDASDKCDARAMIASFADDRIKFTQREVNGNISAASNSALELATGDFIAFLDQDDTLSPFALFWVAELIQRKPNAKIIYSDEDKLSPEGKRHEPHFKPEWNYDYLTGHNYICHLCVIDQSLLSSLGGLREGFEGAQDYDLLLRAIENITPSQIYHIPRILYHWRQHAGSTSTTLSVKPNSLYAGQRALEEHLARTQCRATVSIRDEKFRVKRELPSLVPKVTILIPSRNQRQLLETCVSSITNKTDYPNYEIAIIDNGSNEADALTYLAEIQTDRRIKVIVDNREFNFSALMNSGIRRCQSDYVCLMNNDVEVINKDWLTTMMTNAIRPDVGAVGAKLLYRNHTIQHGGIVLGIGGVAGHAHKTFPADHVGYFHRLDLPQQLSAVTAACMVLRVSAFNQTAGFDEKHLPIAFNDVDFCLKLGDAGFKVVFTPDAILYHHESMTRGSESTQENRERFLQEFNVMRSRWGERLRHDPAYNPNLSLLTENFDIAEESRAHRMQDVLINCSRP